MARSTPTFRCLHQPLLVAGCERTPVVLVGGAAIMCACMAWFSWSLIALCTAGFLFLVGIPFLQALAKRDPQMVQIAFRFSRYRRHYPAQLTRQAPRRSPRPIFALIVLTVVIGAWLLW